MTEHHHAHAHAPTAATDGNVIRWAGLYDLAVKILAMGQDTALRRETLERAGLAPGETVLDVGCGTGDLTLLASRAVGPHGRVFGADAAPEMIRVAQRKARLAGASAVFRPEPIERLSFADGTFDAVLSSLMMHHLPGDLKLKGMLEVRRVLKPGGRLLIADFCAPEGPAPWLLRLAASHMASPESARELREVVARAGFVDVRVTYSNLRVIAFVSGRAPR